MSCPYIPMCPMFPKFRSQFGLEVFKTAYCNSTRHLNCERYRHAVQGNMPPANLLPNGRELVEEPRE